MVFYLGRFALQQASHSILLWQQPKNVKGDSTVDPFSGTVMNERTPSHLRTFWFLEKIVLQNGTVLMTSTNNAKIPHQRVIELKIV